MFKTTLAYETWKSKYRYDNETPIETFQRVAKALASVEKKPEDWYDKFLKTMVRFNSDGKPVGLKCTAGGRITANIGTSFKKATLINCFIGSPVDSAKIEYIKKTDNGLVQFPVTYETDANPDDLINIFLTIMEQAKTLASEGGYGINFDFIRPRGSLIKGTGIKHPGVVAYMKIWDAVSECIVQGDTDGYIDKIRNYLKSEDKTQAVIAAVKDSIRKGAMLAALSVSHPDAEEFIRAKQSSGVLTKFNISIVLDDKFMQAVEDDGLYDQSFNGKVIKRIKARELYDLIMQSTYNRSEPGVLFSDNMMKNNPIAYLGKLSCVNPCFSGDTFLFTDVGCQTFDYYANWYSNPVNILQDNRVSFIGNSEKEDWAIDLKKSGYHYNKASSVFKTQQDAKTLKVEFIGGTDLTLTPDHHLMTSRGPVQAKDLKKNDSVLFCLPESPKDFIRSPLDDAAFLLGMVDSDGGVIEETDKYIVYIDLYGKKLDMKKAVLSKIEKLYKLYGAEISLDQQRDISSCYITEDKKRDKVRIGSSFLYRLFIKHFNWCGKKQIPVNFSLYSRKYALAINYLSGFFVCDGHSNFSKGCDSIRINQSDRPFLKKMQSLLWSLGIDSGLYLRRKAQWKKMPDGKGGLKEYFCEENFELIITKSFFTKFINLFDLIKFFKFDDIKSRLTNIPRDISSLKKVTKITEAEIQDVYCLKEDIDRTLVANGVVARRCGEIPGLSSITTVCLLGSPNLTQYVKIGVGGEPYFDFDEYSEDVSVFMRMLDNVNDLTYSPLPSYQWVIENLRQVGMGINGLGSTLMMLKIAYDSPEAIEFTKRVSEIKENLTWQTSALLAKERGPFSAYDKELFVSTEYFNSDRINDETKNLIRKYGVRNAKTTTCPPLGNSSIIADITSNGVEPVFLLEYERKVICKVWPEDLTADNVKDLFKRHKEKDYEYWSGSYKGKKYYYEPHNRGLCEINTVRDFGYQWLLDNYPNEDHSAYLKTSMDIAIDDHLAVQKMVQYYNNQSVSKTCNLPNEYPFEDFKSLYIKAWKSGLNGFTTYRDGSMESVLSEINKGEKRDIIVRDIQLPDVFINGETHIIKREGKKFYLHFSYLPEDSNKEFPIVIWIHTNAKYKADELKVCNKAARNLSKLALERGIDRAIVAETVDKANDDYPHNRLGRMVSLCLRHNIPREDILVSLMGIDGDNISTLLTAVRKFLSKTLPDGTKLKGLKCPECGEPLIMDGGCQRCPSCPWSACG